MSLSKLARHKSQKQCEPSVRTCVPVRPFDVTRSYDIYCSPLCEQRLYENVKVICIRTFDKITKFSSGAIGGLLEIEAADGTRMLIPQHGIQMICAPGAQPKYKVLSSLGIPDIDDIIGKKPAPDNVSSLFGGVHHEDDFLA